MAVVGSVVRRLYLSVYYWVVFFGWVQVLSYMMLALLESRHEAVYAVVERPLQLAQTATFMEVMVLLVAQILHSIVGGPHMFRYMVVLWKEALSNAKTV